MAFASLETGDEAEPLAEINMVPLIDVMLVLLIIFMVTAPLLTHAVKVDLPKATSTLSTGAGESIELSIDSAGQVFWNGQAIAADALERRLADTAATLTNANTGGGPEIRLRADRQTPYERVAQLMSTAARHGLTRLSFVTDPTPASVP